MGSINFSFTAIAIGSAFFAAIASILARKLLIDLKSKDIIGINFLTMGATLVLLSPLFYSFQASYLTMGLLLLMAFIDTLANYFYFKTFEKTEASVATPILALAPAFTFLFSWTLLDDVVSVQTLLVALLIIILVVLFSSDFRNFHHFKAVTLIPAGISAVLFGLSAIPAKYLLDTAGVINGPTLYMFRACFIALFSLLLFQFPFPHITIGQYRFIFLRGLFVIAQWLLLYYALTIGNAGVTLTLGNTAPIFVFFLSAIFLRERITVKKVFAAVLIFVLSLTL